MNIWSLDKQNTIRQLLVRLEEAFGKESFHVLEPEETNALSVRIAPPDESVTIYIYGYGQNPGNYGLHIEYPRDVGTPTSQDEAIYDDLPPARLIDILGLYLF